MPTYKVGFPYIVVKAPNEKAALAAFEMFAEDARPPEPEATVVGDVPDFTVDAEGYQIAGEE